METQKLNFPFLKAYGQQSEGETQIYRSIYNNDGLQSKPEYNINTLQDAFLSTMNKYENKQFLFSRNPQTQKYEGLTYEQVYKQAVDIGSGIINMNLAPENTQQQNLKVNLVGIYAKNRLEWILVDIASQLYGLTVLPLYDTLGVDNLSFCLKHSGVINMFSSGDGVNNLLNLPELGNLKYIISFDQITQEQNEKAQQRNIVLLHFNQIQEAGKQKIIIDLPKFDSEQIMTFTYTSGTTGPPKAAMLSHRNFTSILAVFKSNKDISITDQDVYLSYLPLPHVFDRLFIWSFIYYAGSIYMYGGDVQKLTKDLAEVKPTIFCSVPRLFNRFYDVINQQLSLLTGMKKLLFNFAYQQKLANAKIGLVKHFIWDNLIFKKIRQMFGGKIRLMITGSAPIQEEVMQFFKIVLGVNFIQGFGMSESSGASFIGQIENPRTHNVGLPSSNVEFKLVDVPELEYYVTHKNNLGQIIPQGELCYRGPGVFSGYFKDQKKTDEVLEPNGFLHSGDIAQILQDGTLQVIDRKKNIFKLSQGEYIAPIKIEHTYLKAKGITEIFVHGDSLKHYLVAIVVPDKDYILNLGKQFNLNNSFEELCKCKEIIEQIQKNMDAQAKLDKLQGFEFVKKIYLEPKNFQMLGCMTNTLKMQRHIAKKIFENNINIMYEQ